MNNAPATVDGLQNVVSGLNMQGSKRMNNVWVYDALLNWQQLDAAYQTNWIARQICDVPSEDMTREWRDIKCQDAEAIYTVERDIGLRVAVQEALVWARLYGGAGILMLTGQPLDKPLNMNKIKKGDLQRLIVFDRWDMQAQTLNTWNILAANYLQPEFYVITSGGQQIHWSHFVRFNGARLPRRQQVVTQGWGDSELRKCLADIADMVAAKDGIAELMQEANIDVINRDGLADELASDQDEAIKNRYTLFKQMKSVFNLALLDGEDTEKFSRMTLNLSGVAGVLETFMTWISGASDIPLTRLFGTSAKGLNATGEGDLSNYYNSIRSKQTHQLDPAMHVLDQVMVRSALGFVPDDYDYEWRPLEQMNVVETAQAELLRAQKDAIMLESGIVTQPQVMRRLQANDEYQFDDDEIKAIEENGSFRELPDINTQSQQLDDAVFMERYAKMQQDGHSHDAIMSVLNGH